MSCLRMIPDIFHNSHCRVRTTYQVSYPAPNPLSDLSNDSSIYLTLLSFRLTLQVLSRCNVYNGYSLDRGLIPFGIAIGLYPVFIVPLRCSLVSLVCCFAILRRTSCLLSWADHCTTIHSFNFSYFYCFTTIPPPCSTFVPMMYD